jgi:hypothetical protein
VVAVVEVVVDRRFGDVSSSSIEPMWIGYPTCSFGDPLGPGSKAVRARGRRRKILPRRAKIHSSGFPESHERLRALVQAIIERETSSLSHGARRMGL